MAEAPRMKIADLDDRSLEKIRALEEEMGPVCWHWSRG